jgi:hypothetical protein
MRFRFLVGTVKAPLVVVLLAALCSAGFGDKVKEGGELSAAPPVVAVLMPDLGASPDPASGLSVVAWQHVVALGQKGRGGETGPVMLISCRSPLSSPSEKELVQACAQEVMGRLGTMRLGAASEAGAHTIQVVLGPEDALKSLSGPRPRPPELASKPDTEQKGSATGAPQLTQAVLEAGEGWAVQMEPDRGLALAWLKTAPGLRLRIVAQSLMGVLDEQGSATKGAAAEEPSAPAEEAQMRLPVPFDRVQLLPHEAGAGGLERVRLRFFPPAMADGFQLACDTGAMSLPVPQGWEVRYLEERLWLGRSPTSLGESAPAANSKASVWPWLPTVSGTPSVSEGMTQGQGGLAIGARVGRASAAVLGCVSWSEPLDGLLPAFRAVLEGLRLSSGVSQPQAPGADAASPGVSISPGPAQFALPDQTVLGDSPEWIAALMAQEQAVEAMNAAILAGVDVVDLETEAAGLRLQQAVERLNEEMLALYPEGGEPLGWAHERVDELVQELFLEEVKGQ